MRRTKLNACVSQYKIYLIPQFPKEVRMMYENAEEVIARILIIVEKCPDALKEKCFEVLLRGYVEKELLATGTISAQNKQPKGSEVSDVGTSVPEAVLQRFQATAKRLSID